MSGGAWEKTAGLVNNGNKNLAIYGQSLLEQVQNGKSSKYVTVYSHDVNVDKDGADIDKAREANWKANTQINGDGICETSTAGTGKTSWYGDFSYFPAMGDTFCSRGGMYWDVAGTGLFFFSCHNGYSYFHSGFRSVLVAK